MGVGGREGRGRSRECYWEGFCCCILAWPGVLQEEIWCIGLPVECACRSCGLTNSI